MNSRLKNQFFSFRLILDANECEVSDFSVFISQVYSDYLDAIAEKVEHETAIKLGVLEIRRQYKDMKANVFEKKSNFELLE